MQIYYYRQRTNAVADLLSYFSKRNQADKETLKAKNSKIICYLQILLRTAPRRELSMSISSLQQVFICRTYGLPKLTQFWEKLRDELTKKKPYQFTFEVLWWRLPQLQADIPITWEIRIQSLQKGWNNTDKILHGKELRYIPEIIRSEVIGRNWNDPLTKHFRINKIRDLITRRYYFSIIWADVEWYIKKYNVCPTSKVVRRKLYDDLELVPILT